VFPADQVLTLAIQMTRDEYAAMQADFEALGGGEEDPGVFVVCQGKAEGDRCQLDAGNGPEAGTCQRLEEGLGCWLDAWDEPPEATGSSDPVELPDPCGGKGDGDVCTQGTRSGVCRRTTGRRICEVDGFDPASVDDVPVEAAVPMWNREPAYFHAEVDFVGAHYTSVGIRYKGNNGLASSIGPKKPFRLKFDRWEKENPAIADQRAYGFRDLSFSPNQTDGTNLHQVLASTLFRVHGVPAPHSAFVEVTLDTGDGPRSLGLYAMTELPDDRLPGREFGSDSGNIYKPDGRGAHFVAFVQGSFHKQNNKASGYDDIIRFIDALHASQRDRAAWRAGIRATFDMDGFLRALAINQAIGNWDTYGIYAHNFYLYADPATGQLRFLPWDFDLSLEGTLSDLSLRSYTGHWPLLQAIARDVEFATLYAEWLATFARAELDSGQLLARIDLLAALIRPVLERENVQTGTTLERFDAALPCLARVVREQGERISEFLTRGATSLATSEPSCAAPPFGLRGNGKLGPRPGAGAVVRDLTASRAAREHD
jgi:hypothetical protein